MKSTCKCPQQWKRVSGLRNRRPARTRVTRARESRHTQDSTFSSSRVLISLLCWSESLAPGFIEHDNWYTSYLTRYVHPELIKKKKKKKKKLHGEAPPRGSNPFLSFYIPSIQNGTPFIHLQYNIAPLKHLVITTERQKKHQLSNLLNQPLEQAANYGVSKSQLVFYCDPTIACNDK